MLLPVQPHRTRTSLKAFKEAIKPGITITVLDHWVKNHCTARLVTKVQGNGYWFTQPTDAEPKRYWGDFPKASQLDFDGKIAKIVLDARRFWTLSI